MTPDTLWQEITIAALLGTQRKPFQPSRSGGGLGELISTPTLDSLAEIENGSGPDGGERLLLRAAVLTTFHRRAGKLPVLRAPIFPTPAPAVEWPRCSFQAGRCLEQILNGTSLALLPEWVETAAGASLALLPEWVETAAGASQRVREEHLPAMLDQQKALHPLRRTVLPVLGARGRWLAAQNPDWCAFAASGTSAASSTTAASSTSAASSTTAASAWSEGQRKERLAYLEDLRAQDPAAARGLLASTWPEEAPAERLVFLQVLADGLSLADESFLETALDDRRKDVRQAAVALLARLPDSDLVRRMTARARVLLTWKPGLLRGSVEVTLPDACDPGMLRDGIDPRLPAGSSFGEKAWWFTQILSFVPPRTWDTAWNKRPLQILETIRKYEWEAALLEGWQEAALRAGDAGWLEAIINYTYRSGEQKRLMDLFPRLPAALKERLTVALLREYPSLSYDQNASFFLSTCRHPWSRDLTQTVTDSICHTLQTGDFQPWRWEKLLRDIAPFFHPALLETTVARITAALKKKNGGDPFVANLLVTLEFRLEMHHAFTHP